MEILKHLSSGKRKSKRCWGKLTMTTETRQFMRDTFIEAEKKQLKYENKGCFRCETVLEEGDNIWVTSNNFIYCVECWKQLPEGETDK